MKKINKELKNLIEKNPMSLATVSGSGKPNVIGVAYVKVMAKNQILISDNYMKTSVRNIKKNNKVGLAVWNKQWKGYKLSGTAKYFTTGKWKQFIEKMKENKEMPAKGAILVTLKEIRKLA